MFDAISQVKAAKFLPAAANRLAPGVEGDLDQPHARHVSRSLLEQTSLSGVGGMLVHRAAQGMLKLHITQDDHGYWMVSVENEDGLLNLLAYEFATSAKAVEHANDWMKERNVQAVVLIDPPRPPGATRSALAAPDDHPKPAPRRAGA